MMSAEFGGGLYSSKLNYVTLIDSVQLHASL